MKPRIRKVCGMWECIGDNWVSHGFTALEAYAKWKLTQLPEVKAFASQQTDGLNSPWWRHLLGIF